MKYEVISVSSWDCDPYTFDPSIDPRFSDNPDCWGMLLTFTIGSNGAGDNFDLYVCSRDWISRPEWVQYTLVDYHWNIKEIIRLVNIKIEECTEDTWEKTAKRLSKYMLWEFDDYQP